ncbi:uncharacterized protein LOC135111371 isoform X2 [Scylla paramamosain]|uniref:uncharacterized protein LOC135111371 isoform X2 n=1 Tax=Scylla paramamosain TaxID=85552 RepID=UPI003083AA18
MEPRCCQQHHKSTKKLHQDLFLKRIWVDAISCQVECVEGSKSEVLFRWASSVQVVLSHPLILDIIQADLLISRVKDKAIEDNRGSRGGKSVMRPIKVVTSSAREDCRVEKREYKHFEVPRVWYSLPSLLFNATSLANKMDKLIVMVRSTCVDIVAVTEAWQIVPEVCTMQDYQLYHHLRSGQKWGGSGHFLPLCPQPLTPPCQYSCRCGGPVGESYAPLPSQQHSLHHRVPPPRAATAQLLTAHTINTADALRVRYPAAKLVICQDFDRLDINDILHQLHLTQVVDFPTHQQAILDLILTDLGQQYSPPKLLPPMGRSTHLSILWTPTATTSTRRPIPDSAMREFGQWVTQHPWTEVLDVEDVHLK